MATSKSTVADKDTPRSSSETQASLSSTSAEQPNPIQAGPNSSSRESENLGIFKVCPTATRVSNKVLTPSQINFENLEIPLSPNSASPNLAIPNYSSKVKATSKTAFADTEISRSSSETQTFQSSSSTESEIPRYLSQTKENPNKSSADIVIRKYSSKPKANPSSSKADLESPQCSLITLMSPSTSKDYRAILSSSFEDSLRLMISMRKQRALSTSQNDDPIFTKTISSSLGEESTTLSRSCEDSTTLNSSLGDSRSLNRSKVDPTTFKYSLEDSQSLDHSKEDPTTVNNSLGDSQSLDHSKVYSTTVNNSLGDFQTLDHSKVDSKVSRRARKNLIPTKLTFESLNTPSVDLQSPCTPSGISVSLPNSKADPTIAGNLVGELVNLSISGYNTTIPSRSFGESVNLDQVKADPMATKKSRKHPAPAKISIEIPTPAHNLSSYNYRIISKVRNHLRKFSTVLMNTKEIVDIIVDLVSKYRQSVMKISDAINSASLSLNTSPNTSDSNSLAAGKKKIRAKMSLEDLRYIAPNYLLQIKTAREEVEADFLDSKLLEQRVARISTDVNGYLRTAEMEATENLPNGDTISLNTDTLRLTQVHKGLNIIHHEILHFKANRKFRSDSVRTLTRDVLHFSRLLSTLTGNEDA